MAKKVDLQERLNMRFLTVAYKEKQEIYGTDTASTDTGSIALDILNIPDTVLEELLELADPMMELVEYLNNNRNPNSKVLGMMLTASKNVFRVVDLLREVPPFLEQDFTWLDENLPRVFSQEAVSKAYRERKKEQGELFIQAMCLVAQLGFGIRDFREALIPLVESLEDEDISRNPKGFSQKFDSFSAKMKSARISGCPSPMYPWNMFQRKMESSGGCTMHLFPACSVPICMKHWLWAMHQSVVPSAESSS